MQKKLWICVALLLIVPGMLLFTVSCAQQTVKTEEPMAAEEAPAAEETPAAAETEAMEEQEPAMMESDADEMAVEAARNMFVNEHVYFAFDRSSLDEIAQATLRRKAEWLNDNSTAYVTVEGHCDERGTAEYNLALGDRRAQSVKNFLVDLGIDATRISTVSYGEERPIDPASNEEAWAKNRRAQFRLE